MASAVMGVTERVGNGIGNDQTGIMCFKIVATMIRVAEGGGILSGKEDWD